MPLCGSACAGKGFSFMQKSSDTLHKIIAQTSLKITSYPLGIFAPTELFPVYRCISNNQHHHRDHPRDRRRLKTWPENRQAGWSKLLHIPIPPSKSKRPCFGTCQVLYHVEKCSMTVPLNLVLEDASNLNKSASYRKYFRQWQTSSLSDSAFHPNPQRKLSSPPSSWKWLLARKSARLSVVWNGIGIMPWYK